MLPPALRHRNYRLFFAGQGISMLGWWVQMTAQAWLMLELTGSAAAVALLAVAQQGPGLVLGPFAGALADRHDKRRLLIAAQSVTLLPALCLALLAFAGRVQALHIVLLALVAGISRAVEIPTRQAFIPQIVGLQDLPSAIGLNSALFNGARLVGPPLAGAITVTAGAAWCFLANALSFLPIVAALLLMELPRHQPAGGERGSLLSEVREGVRYVARQPEVRALFVALGISSFAGMSYTVLLPSFSERVLGGDAGTFGLLQGAIGAGAITSALALALRGGSRGLERWLLGAAVLFGVALIGVSRTTTLAPALLTLVVAGAALMIQLAATNTLIQLTVPDQLRGRVMALYSALFLGAFPLGGLIAGAVADRIGEPSVMAVGGTLVVAGALWSGPAILGSRPARPAGVVDSDSG